MEFIDDYGYSGYFRDSDWFYQKWHTYEQRMALGPLVGLTPKEKEVGEYWRCWGPKEFQAPWQMVQRAIEFEFELPWPCGQRIGRSEMVKKSLRRFWPEDAQSLDPNIKQWWPNPMPINPNDKDLVGFF
jgi:ParB family chromosome partitioning protein